jgi:hypothetical protein
MKANKPDPTSNEYNTETDGEECLTLYTPLGTLTAVKRLDEGYPCISVRLGDREVAFVEYVEHENKISTKAYPGGIGETEPVITDFDTQTEG